MVTPGEAGRPRLKGHHGQTDFDPWCPGEGRPPVGTCLSPPACSLHGQD